VSKGAPITTGLLLRYHHVIGNLLASKIVKAEDEDLKDMPEVYILMLMFLYTTVIQYLTAKSSVTLGFSESTWSAC
jgi:hypothetical protein